MTYPLCYEAKQGEPLTSVRRKASRARTAAASTEEGDRAETNRAGSERAAHA